MLAADSLDLLGLEPGSQLSAAPETPAPLPLPLFDADFQCSLQQLFRIVMGPDAVFVKTQHSRHDYWDVSIGEWATHAGGTLAAGGTDAWYHKSGHCCCKVSAAVGCLTRKAARFWHR